ncbi:OmpA family protein [Kangiella shandongensis]|uniref:OmpA family protein n=1 Tax=Kangiella shandongensis TaxID=2763258 RepID=UPI001CBC3F9A|nr:OmpA family protein [Kangiella shandongensis]
MLRIIAVTISIMCWAVTAPAADVEGAKDHPLTGRFEGAEIIEYSYRDFDEFRFIVEPLTSRVKKENAKHMVTREGKLTRMTYRAPQGTSSLAMFRAYEDALAKNNAEIIFECSGNSGQESCTTRGSGNNFKYVAPGYSVLALVFGNAHNDKTRYLVAKIARAEGDAYVSLHVIQNGRTNSEGSSERVFAQVDVLEEKAQESKVVMVKASEMAEKIDLNGKVALYGLYFDSNKASIKSESKPTLDEIAKLLKDNPDLKLLVVGHSDNQGDFAYNVDLSKRRAASVKQALTSNYGINASRLKPWGVGYAAPVASNNAEQGRAKNRRVELVAQ